MNWGYRILVVIILFVVGMVSMVYVSMQQTNDMLDDNYYVEEKKFQSLLDAQEALKSIQQKPLLVQNDTEVTIQLPSQSYDDIQDAYVHFIKPDNQKLDVKFDFTPDEEGHFNISKSDLVKGVYKVRVKWYNADKMYYSDDNFYVM